MLTKYVPASIAYLASVVMVIVGAGAPSGTSRDAKGGGSMARALVGYLFVLPILALWSETAGALTLTVTPKDAKVGQNVTLTISDLAPYLAVGYQVSEDNGVTWKSLTATNNPSSVYVCHLDPKLPGAHPPCTLVFPSPGRETALVFRVMVVDPQSRKWIYGSRTNQVVSWQTQTTTTYTGAFGVYWLNLTVNGKGCTIVAKPNDLSDANRQCRVRGPLDVHDARVPVVFLGVHGPGGFVSQAFTIVAAWSPLPQGTWMVSVTHGNYSTNPPCTSNPCILKVPNQTFGSEQLGRYNAVALLNWVAGTRGNPEPVWPGSLAAEIGIDFMRH